MVNDGEQTQVSGRIRGQLLRGGVARRAGPLRFLLGLTSPWVHGSVLGHQWVGSVRDISLQLRLKLVNLVAQVSDDVLIGADMLRNHFLVRFHSHFNVLGAIGIL